MSLEVAKEDSDSEALLLKILKHRHFGFWKRKEKKNNTTNSGILLSLLFLRMIICLKWEKMLLFRSV